MFLGTEEWLGAYQESIDEDPVQSLKIIGS